MSDNERDNNRDFPLQMKSEESFENREKRERQETERLSNIGLSYLPGPDKKNPVQ